MWMFIACLILVHIHLDHCQCKSLCAGLKFSFCGLWHARVTNKCYVEKIIESRIWNYMKEANIVFWSSTGTRGIGKRCRQTNICSAKAGWKILAKVVADKLKNISNCQGNLRDIGKSCGRRRQKHQQLPRQAERLYIFCFVDSRESVSPDDCWLKK